MSRPRRVLDVSDLPNTVFGARGLIWWGTVGYIAIEATMFAVVATTFFYVRKNFESFPPLGTRAPDLVLPTVNLFVMVLSCLPMRYAEKASREFDSRKIRTGLYVSCAFALVFLVLRVFDFKALNTRWDSDAYGSALWAILVTHTLILVLEVIETVLGAIIFGIHREEPKHIVDVTDNALYWYFLMLIWIPLYLIVYWGPRVL